MVNNSSKILGGLRRLGGKPLCNRLANKDWQLVPTGDSKASWYNKLSLLVFRWIHKFSNWIGLGRIMTLPPVSAAEVMEMAEGKFAVNLFC